MSTWEWISIGFSLIGILALMLVMYAPRDLDYVNAEEEQWERRSCK